MNAKQKTARIKRYYDCIPILIMGLKDIMEDPDVPESIWNRAAATLAEWDDARDKV